MPVGCEIHKVSALFGLVTEDGTSPIEEKVELVHPDSEETSKKVMSQFMDENQNGECEDQLRSFNEENYHARVLIM